MDDVRRAYAVLGLPAGSPYPAVRRRYRELVKTWHPDRFASDPQGQSEASLRLQLINAAYSALERHHDVPGGAFHASSPGRSPSGRRTRARPSGRRLTRAEIDAIVAAIGSDGPLDELFRTVARIGHPIESLLGAVWSRWGWRGRR